MRVRRASRASCSRSPSHGVEPLCSAGFERTIQERPEPRLVVWIETTEHRFGDWVQARVAEVLGGLDRPIAVEVARSLGSGERKRSFVSPQRWTDPRLATHLCILVGRPSDQSSRIAGDSTTCRASPYVAQLRTSRSGSLESAESASRALRSSVEVSDGVGAAKAEDASENELSERTHGG